MPKMDQQAIDSGIGRLRRERILVSPSSIYANVQRKIRQRETPGSHFGLWLDALVPQTRFVVGACAVALIATVATTHWMVALSPDRPAAARVALGFEEIARSPSFPFDHP